MKVFLKQVAAFVLILVVFNVVFLVIVEQLYFREYRQVDLHYHKYLLADSRGVPLGKHLDQYGIYNFSVNGDSYFDMYAKAKYLLDHAPVDTLYLSVDDHTLSIYRERRDNSDRSIIYKGARDFPNYYDYWIAKYVKRYVAYFNSSYRDIVTSYLKSRIRNVVGLRHSPPWVALTPEAQKVRAQRRFNQQFFSASASDSLVATLQKIIALCQRHDVTLIGIRFPLTQTFIRAMDGRSYGAEGYFKKHDLPVYDFKKKYRYHDEYFYNEDHLNERGGEVFAKEFSQIK